MGRAFEERAGVVGSVVDAPQPRGGLAGVVDRRGGGGPWGRRCNTQGIYIAHPNRRLHATRE